MLPSWAFNKWTTDFHGIHQRVSKLSVSKLNFPLWSVKLVLSSCLVIWWYPLSFTISGQEHEFLNTLHSTLRSLYVYLCCYFHQLHEWRVSCRWSWSCSRGRWWWVLWICLPVCYSLSIHLVSALIWTLRGLRFRPAGVGECPTCYWRVGLQKAAVLDRSIPQ